VAVSPRSSQHVEASPHTSPWATHVQHATQAASAHERPEQAVAHSGRSEQQSRGAGLPRATPVARTRSATAIAAARGARSGCILKVLRGKMSPKKP
jgi:hypothetical protein